MAGKLNIPTTPSKVIHKGDHYSWFTITCVKNGTPIDLTGATISLCIEKNGNTLYEKSNSGGIDIINFTAGQFRIEPFALDHAGLLNYWITIEKNNIKKTYIEGLILVKNRC